MARDSNLILQLPFDESDGSKVAYDYAPHRYDAALTGCSFTAGKQGNCIHFDGEGVATTTVDPSVLPLSGNFTILAWFKATNWKDGCTGRRIGLFANTASLEDFGHVWADVTTDDWGFVTIRKSGDLVSLYLDTVLIGSVTLNHTCTGVALLQDVYSSEYAYADLDELKIYDYALAEDEIAEELKNITALKYYLGGVAFDDLDIHVESSSGVLDLPKLKTPTEVEWPDYHGKVVDLYDKRFEAREITLNCWLRAAGKMDFVSRFNQLLDLLREDGTARLMISIHPTKPLVYEVYNEDGISASKKWHDDKMIGTFTLKLKEPDPVKRVIRHTHTGTSDAKLTVAFNSPKMVNIYWGDGTVTEDVYGDHTGSNALSHTYADNGVYYAIVGGVIEEITDFTTNGIVVWNKL